MIHRLKTNTETLQQHFPDTYRQFFAISQRVASASHSFLWAGDFAGFYGGLMMTQKLPFRAYTGFETTFDHAISIAPEYTTFEPAEQQFVQRPLDSDLKKNLQQYLQKHFLQHPHFTGITVHILTEMPLGHSLGANGAIAASLARLLHDSDDVDVIFKTARNILSASQSGHSSGVSAYAALANSTTPIVFHAGDGQPYAKSIDQLIKLEKSAAWPIDFGLIYTGSETNAESVVLANDHAIAELDTAAGELNDLLHNHTNLDFKTTYINMLNMTSGLLVTALSDLFKKGVSNARLDSLFSTMNQYQNLLHILEVSNSTTDLLYGRIHQLANKQVNDVGSGAKISGIGKGGALLFALPYATHRADLIALIEQVRTTTGKSVWLDYASWIDGVETKGAVLEQDIAKGIYSSFIGRDVRNVTVLRQGTQSDQVLTNEHFAEFAPTIDLLLDKTTSKISIAGTTVTSKELPSQKATVAIVADLIMAPNFTLTNDQLPGTYGTNRYDLHGKIVLPLIKQVKELTGRDLQLSIQGNMYDHYTLSLNPSNIVIGVVEQKV